MGNENNGTLRGGLRAPRDAALSKALSALWALEGRQRNDWGAVAAALSSTLGLPAGSTAADVAELVLRDSYAAGRIDSLIESCETREEPAEEVLDKGPSALEVLEQLEGAQRDGM